MGCRSTHISPMDGANIAEVTPACYRGLVEAELSSILVGNEAARL
jgi:hypothetical protein